MKKMIQKTVGAIALLVLTTFTATSSFAAGIIVTPDTVLNSDGWAIGAPNMSGYKAAITDAGNFGAGGIVSTAVTLNEVGTVDAAALSGASIFISPWWNDGEASPAAVSAVVNFFLAGGNLFLLQDDAGHDPIGEALGLVTANSSTNPHDILAPEINNGSFGTALVANQAFTQGFLDTTAIATNGGTVAATDSGGRATMAIWDYGDYAAGAGRMIIMADVDFISTEGGANYTTGSLSTGAILGLNATEYLLGAAPVPEPGAALLLLLGLGGLVGRRKAKAA